ncbi:hypothetical protein OF829_13075 [Sphingomonas sp. LB-2]|uniref:hypothetical protein n=1 Tax=Sphingomonas caeni TaxID=2984949 RepID=UPI0022323408|nr:hypothetical protein [Sphingomonas caeni]MCW3848172.1 hypothetical protein [Sphingomonas caeni]
MDEDALFEWLKKIVSIKDVYGESDSIVLVFENNGASDEDFHELIAVYKRYNIARSGLIGLVNQGNEDWVRRWDEEIFL